MTFTLLLDLDDTLLQNPLDKFLPAYVHALADHLAQYVSPEKMIPQLMHATDRMISKADGCETLETTFDEDFYFPLGLQKEQLGEVLLDFYEKRYDELRSITSPVSFSRTLIEHALKNGWRIVIATNPLFPRIAVVKRLEWAGIPASDYPYDLITAYENMHFSKPHSAYYAEILGQLGWEEGLSAMVGNSLTDDLLPSSALGIPGYYLGNDPSGLKKLSPNSAAGPLEKILPWLDKIAEKPTQQESNNLEGILAVLRTTPAVVQSLTGTCSRTDWRKHPIQGEWSLLEIICHLRDVEREVNLPRFELLKNAMNPFILGVDTDRWAVERHYNDQDESTVYTDFCMNRSKLLEIIGRYSPSEWQSTLRHSFFGPTTRQELAKFIAAHDRDHINQISQTIAHLE